MMQQLTAEAIPAIDDGVVGLAIDQAFVKVANDVYARPGLKASRKVIVEIEFKKLFPDDSESMDQKTVVSVDVKLPKQTTSVAMVRGENGMEFNDKATSSDDPRQTHIDDLIG